MSENKFKRQHRALSEATKEKISKALSGRKLSEEHRTRIASSMKRYWSRIPD